MTEAEFESITREPNFARMSDRIARWVTDKIESGLFTYTHLMAAGQAIATPAFEFLDGIQRSNTGSPTYGSIEPTNIEEDGCITLVALPPALVSDMWKNGSAYTPDSFSITDFRMVKRLGQVALVREKYNRIFPAFARVPDSQAKGRLGRMAVVRSAFPGVSRSGVNVGATLCEWRWVEQEMQKPDAERLHGVGEIYDHCMARPGFKAFLSGETVPSGDPPRTIEKKAPRAQAVTP